MVGKMLEDLFVGLLFWGKTRPRSPFFGGKKNSLFSTFRRVGWLGNTCSCYPKKNKKTSNFQPTKDQPPTFFLNEQAPSNSNNASCIRTSHSTSYWNLNMVGGPQQKCSWKLFWMVLLDNWWSGMEKKTRQKKPFSLGLHWPVWSQKIYTTKDLLKRFGCIWLEQTLQPFRKKNPSNTTVPRSSSSPKKNWGGNRKKKLLETTSHLDLHPGR